MAFVAKEFPRNTRFSSSVNIRKTIIPQIRPVNNDNRETEGMRTTFKNPGTNNVVLIEINLLLLLLLLLLLFTQHGWSSGWSSGESTCLPLMWPGFDSQTRRHMWVGFVVGSCPSSVRFSSGYFGFSLFLKTSIPHC